MTGTRTTAAVVMGTGATESAAVMASFPAVVAAFVSAVDRLPTVLDVVGRNETVGTSVAV